MTFHSEFLIGLGVEITPCGSRVTCDPPPTDTDEDYLLLVPPGREIRRRIDRYLTSERFFAESNVYVNQPSENAFQSWRREPVNLIVTCDPEFARRHKAATAECKRWNVARKIDRVAIFQWILYGNDTGLECPWCGTSIVKAVQRNEGPHSKHCVHFRRTGIT